MGVVVHTYTSLIPALGTWEVSEGESGIQGLFFCFSQVELQETLPQNKNLDSQKSAPG